MARPVSWKTIVLLPPLILFGGFGLMIPMVKSFRSCGCRSEPRSAQNLVSIYQSARSCGVVFRPSTLDELVDTLTAGVVVDDCASPFYGKRFSIGKCSEQVRRQIHAFTCYDPRTGELDYLPPSNREQESCCD